jgi:hypothetical protein
VCWNAKSATFSWWSGQVTLPAGFSYEQDHAGDTFEGHFISSDGKTTIRHDIGGYAGAWADWDKSFLFEETVVEGARVWISKQLWPSSNGVRTILTAVTFPDSGCANFFLSLDAPESKDVALIESIAKSFRPKGRITSGGLCDR